MIELPADRSPTHLWIVCERTTRWIDASRRFVPEMTLHPQMIACRTDQVRAKLAGHVRAVVVWELEGSNTVATCDQIIRIATVAPKVMQIAVATDLSDAQRLILAEFRIAMVLRHVEELPRFGRLIQGYFAGSPQHLD